VKFLILRLYQKKQKVSGADFLILDEGEITLPMFVEAITGGRSLESCDGEDLQ
jgi:radical SAM superfamily enzyme YgiQ (UPF0313 family)